MMTYTIDRNDCIFSADEAWDAFADLNNGPKRDAVVGRPLWSQIADGRTRQIWRHLLDRARDGHPIQLTMRCDAPAVRRMVRLVATAEPARAVRFESLVVEEARRAAIALLDPNQPRGHHEVMLCSWCHAVRVGTTWEPLEVVAGRDELFEAPHGVPAITHGICDDCEHAMV